MEIRRISEADGRGGFSCGDTQLDGFFARNAAKNALELRVGTTYVGVDAGAILGFVTVAATSIQRDLVHHLLGPGYPNYPLPALLLARMAVALGHQKTGIGHRLMRYVLDLAVEQADRVGCVGVVVDAKPKAVSYYDSLQFKALEQAEPRGEQLAMFLPIRTVLDARTNSG